ncbi:MAG: hypothetical protein ISS70_02135 [Phycisphaerae bacterium]|nr:hypothetical protein [Phycisphaerae bacterium]
MFTIDLLKGQNVPVKSSPGGIAIAVATVVIPLAAEAIMFGFYLNNKIIISVNEQKIARCQAEIGELSDAVEMQALSEKQKTTYGTYLSEVKSSINRYTQWSPVLVTLVENMPGSLMLTRLEVEQHTVRKKVTQKDNPQEMIEKDVPVRILRISVSGSPQYNCDKAVRDFRDSLRSSAFLGPKLDNIGVSQESGTLEGKDIASYDIDCVFKASL